MESIIIFFLVLKLAEANNLGVCHCPDEFGGRESIFSKSHQNEFCGK